MTLWAGLDEFVAVARERSFTQAAKKQGRSTSQLSRDIAELENRLGQRLFYRTTRHVSLTEAGERFLVSCRRLQEERNEAIAAMLDDSKAPQGQLRMTCAVAYGECFVVPIATRIMAENPRLSIDIVLTDEVVDLVDRGIDLAVRFGRLRDSRLVATRLGSRARLVCASPDYIARCGEPKALEDLAQHECLRGTADVWTLSRDGKPHTYRPQGRFRCNSGYAALSAALSGLGLCQLPDFYVHKHLVRGDLVEVLEHHRPEDEGVWAVYPHRQHVPAKVKSFVDKLHLSLASLAAQPPDRATS